MIRFRGARMKKLLLLFTLFLSPLVAMAQAGVEVQSSNNDQDDDDDDDDDDANFYYVWYGPGWYNGIWFDDEWNYYNYRRNHNWNHQDRQGGVHAPYNDRRGRGGGGGGDRGGQWQGGGGGGRGGGGHGGGGGHR